jgi:hypothetical protein
MTVKFYFMPFKVYPCIARCSRLHRLSRVMLNSRYPSHLLVCWCKLVFIVTLKLANCLVCFKEMSVQFLHTKSKKVCAVCPSIKQIVVGKYVFCAISMLDMGIKICSLFECPNSITTYKLSPSVQIKVRNSTGREQLNAEQTVCM